MRRRLLFAQRGRQSAPDPSGAAGSGPAAVGDMPPPVSRSEEERLAPTWSERPPLKIQSKRGRLSLKRPS